LFFSLNQQIYLSDQVYFNQYAAVVKSEIKKENDLVALKFFKNKFSLLGVEKIDTLKGKHI